MIKHLRASTALAAIAAAGFLGIGGEAWAAPAPAASGVPPVYQTGGPLNQSLQAIGASVIGLENGTGAQCLIGSDSTCKLPIGGSITTSSGGLVQAGNTVTISAPNGSSSAATALGGATGPDQTVDNETSVPIWVNFGTNTVTAAPNTGTLVAAGKAVTIHNASGFAAVYGVGGTGNVYLTTGTGTFSGFGGGGTSGGGGGAVTIAAGGVAAGAYVSGSFLSGAFALGSIVDLGTGATPGANTTNGYLKALQAVFPTTLTLNAGAADASTLRAAVDLRDVAGSAIAQGHGTAATAIRVELPTDGTGVVNPGNTANTTPWLMTIAQGGNSATVTASNALKVDGSAVTQPVSFGLPAGSTYQAGNCANSTNTACSMVASPGVGHSLFGQVIACGNSNTSGSFITLNDAHSLQLYVPPTYGNNLPLPTGVTIQWATNTAATFTPGTNGIATMSCNFIGYSI